MANLKDLKDIGEVLVPIFGELFDLMKNGSEKSDKQKEKAVVGKLKKLVAESGAPTKASLAERAEAIGAARSALTELLIQSAASNEALPSTTVRILQAQRNALRNAFGLLLERATFEDIPQLLSAAKIEEISALMEKADEEIAARQKAKDILDTIVKVALSASKIAVKLG